MSNNSKSRELIAKIFSRIEDLGYLPRWIVFCIDVFIVVAADLTKYALVSSLAPKAYAFIDVFEAHLLVVFVNILFFLYFKTFSGIIRHSTFNDGIKLLFSTTSSFMVLVIIDFLSTSLVGRNLFLIPGLFIGHLLAFLVLFLFRIFVKFFFEKYSSMRAKGVFQKVLIYGTDANAFSVANALKTDSTSRFKILGFVDQNKQNASKQIMGMPIVYLGKSLPVILRSMSADGIIFADKGLSNEDRLKLVDECLEFNYKVYTIPPILDWEDQKAISKNVKNIQIEDLLERKPINLDKKSVSNQLRGKTVLISGAAGSIGSEIARQVLKFDPKRLIILDQAETPLHQLCLEIEGLQTKSETHAVIADIRNRSAVRKILDKYRPEVVYHAAAYKHVPLMEENPSQAILTNVEGTKNLADLACEFEVANFVMVSTDKAVNPSNVMGASKRIAEKYVQSLQLKMDLLSEKRATKFITTRFGNVLGSNGSVVPLFTKQIEEGGPLTITHPDIIRFFMTIPEACQLVLEAGSMGNGGEIYIFDMGKPVKIIDLARKMIKLAGFVPDKDIQIKIVGLRPGEKLYEELLNDTAKTLPTHHEKIMIAQEHQDEYLELHASIDALIDEANSHDKEMIVSTMKRIVPEFISKNSAFEVLDK